MFKKLPNSCSKKSLLLCSFACFCFFENFQRHFWNSRIPSVFLQRHKKTSRILFEFLHHKDTTKISVLNAIRGDLRRLLYLHQKIFCKIINIYYLCTIITFIFNNNNRILHPTKHMLIKSYPKAHIAHLYSPELSAHSARNRLNRWISGDKQLCAALRDVGYFDHQKDHYFTKREIALLFEFIGDPAA